MIYYRLLTADEISRDLFRVFCRRQVVTKCWRKEAGKWVTRDDPFLDDWGERDYEELIGCLKNTLAGGGFVYGAFDGAGLKGFARERKAQKLYISAHSAVESQAFYRAMGCVEAKEYDPAHVEKEPFDCQLECEL